MFDWIIYTMLTLFERMIKDVLHVRRSESVNIEGWNWLIYMEIQKVFNWCFWTYKRFKNNDTNIVPNCPLPKVFIPFPPLHKIRLYLSYSNTTIYHTRDIGPSLSSNDINDLILQMEYPLEDHHQCMEDL